MKVSASDGTGACVCTEKGAGMTVCCCCFEADLMESTDKWRYLAFALLKSLLPSLKAAEASVVLSPNLIKCLISSLSNRQSDLHQAALHLVSITIDTQTP